MFSRLIIIILLSSSLFGRDTIGPGLYESELIEYLRGNYKTNSTLSYTGAREMLYESIDNSGNYVYGVYTNYSVYLPPGTDSPISHLYDNGMDCEHIWPQSMYEGGCPMKCDLHHLRPSKSNVNSARSNKPFNEVNDNQATTWYWMNNQTSNIPSSNIDEYSENHGSYFEPREDRKGDIARSMFYFYTMYAEVADDNFFENQKDILKSWHEMDPADENENVRTWAIAPYQQNKPNPFILDETLIWRAYFYEGFILGDINEDGIINVLDIVELVQVIIEGVNFSPAGDVNQDGQLNILDVIMLVNLIFT